MVVRSLQDRFLCCSEHMFKVRRFSTLPLIKALSLPHFGVKMVQLAFVIPLLSALMLSEVIFSLSLMEAPRSV